MPVRQAEQLVGVCEYQAAERRILGLTVFIWAYAHHFCAGIRFLLLDLNQGIEIRKARMTSYVVFAASIVLTIAFAWRLW